jgi:hypothetical protein
MSDERPPTHRIHWRASADARVVGAHFGFCRTHEAKVRQATFYVNGGLIPERCHFGPRRVRLEGEVDYTPPRWSASQPSRYGRDLADDIMSASPSAHGPTSTSRCGSATSHPRATTPPPTPSRTGCCPRSATSGSTPSSPATSAPCTKPAATVAAHPGDVHRAMMTMLSAAVADGKHVPATALAVKAPTLREVRPRRHEHRRGLACLKVTAEIPHGSRWLFTLLYGDAPWGSASADVGRHRLRRGEFGEAVIDWQLQALPYIDRKNKRARVPRPRRPRVAAPGRRLPPRPAQVEEGLPGRAAAARRPPRAAPVA